MFAILQFNSCCSVKVPVVKKLINSKGNVVANHFVIYSGDSIYLQSYNSIVAKVDSVSNAVTFGVDWDYSVTTLKHLKTFLNDFSAGFNKDTTKSKKQLQSLIDNGVYKIDVNLG